MLFNVAYDTVALVSFIYIIHGAGLVRIEKVAFKKHNAGTFCCPIIITITNQRLQGTCQKVDMRSRRSSVVSGGYSGQMANGHSPWSCPCRSPYR